jgi:hypothetical protein
MQVGAPASRESIFAKAMTFLEQEKWVGLDLLEMKAR